VGLRLAAVAADHLPTAPGELEGFVRLWEREAALTPSALLVEAEAVERAEPRAVGHVARVLERISSPLLVSTRERWRPLRREVRTLEVGKPTRDEQRRIWQVLLGDARGRVNGHLSALVSQFDFAPPTIRASVQEALASGADGEALATALWDAGRAQARSRLDDLAHRIVPRAGWDDLVLTEAEKSRLREIAAHVAHRTTVYETWGFAAASTRGLGISALFAGASGTGKTMAAEVLAGALRLDLYRIDLSGVVSKYIGETEKNLRRVFDAAEDGGAILFFDEADALFGKRSEVKDSHDRYANIEINYLLQRMESYRGLAVLATNMKGALDPAFLRRIRFVITFSLPDATQRAELWRRMFPAATPTQGLDVVKLARLHLPGGNIRNIALNAAFLAAEAGEPVRMPHVLRAVRSEYAKLEKPLTEADTRDLA
jgi:AAA+ superfamily predicted ATPase